MLITLFICVFRTTFDFRYLTCKNIFWNHKPRVNVILNNEINEQWRNHSIVFKKKPNKTGNYAFTNKAGNYHLLYELENEHNRHVTWLPIFLILIDHTVFLTYYFLLKFTTFNNVKCLIKCTILNKINLLLYSTVFRENLDDIDFHVEHSVQLLNWIHVHV